jgi:hypothetical protein
MSVMKINKKFLASIIIILSIVLALFLLYFSQSGPKEERNDTLPPEIISITGDFIGSGGQTAVISADFSDDVKVTSAELFFRPASAINWSSKSILNGTADITLSVNSSENIFYYIIIDDAARNGPVGDPSIDGSQYYIITVSNDTDKNGNDEPEGDNNDGSDNGDDSNQTYTRFAFVELPKPKISCSECPKIAAMVDELYDSGDYPFYYVTLPEENTQGAVRIEEYNVWGFPTIYIDGGYDLIVGSSVEKSMIGDRIRSSAARTHTNLSVMVTAERKENSSEITLTVVISNHESQLYHGQLRVYLTEIVSTTGQGNTPTHFALIDFLINEEIQVPANDDISQIKIIDVSEFDVENLMIFAVVFNSEAHIGYSQPPDKNQFNAHYVDAADATTVVKDGNLPPEIGIQTPAAKYVYRFGKQIRKSFTGNTILLGRTTLVAYASDDSKIEKVEFYIDGTLKKTVTEEPYEWFWHQFVIGKKTVTVKAFDDQGKTASATIDVIAFMKWPGLFTLPDK